MGLGTYTEYNINYIDGDSTSHSYGNRTKLQNIFRKYLGTEIPTIPDYCQEDINVNLIKPYVMSEMCSKLLQNKDVYDLEDEEKYLMRLYMTVYILLIVLSVESEL